MDNKQRVEKRAYAIYLRDRKEDPIRNWAMAEAEIHCEDYIKSEKRKIYNRKDEL